MKIAVCSKEEQINSSLADRFARAEYFIIYDNKNDTFEALANNAKHASGGASGQAVKILGDNNIDIVLCPEVGPKALEALIAFEIKAFNFTGSKNVEDALKMYQENKLIPITISHNKKYK